MKIHVIKYLTSFLLCLFIPIILGAQLSNSAVSNNKYEGWSWGVFTVKSSLLESTSQREGTWSGFGIGLDARYQFKSRLGIAGRLSYRNWGIRKTTYIPLTIGPSYQLPISSKTFISVFGGVGPTGLLGNDYAGIFAAGELGVRIEQKILENKKLFLGASFGQGMSQHPDHFEYFEIILGVHF